MPFLALVHLRERRCPECNTVLGAPGARSFVVDRAGNPVSFSSEDPPEAMTVEFVCPRGHHSTLNVPDDLSAEETISTPEGAPIGCDAMIVA